MTEKHLTAEEFLYRPVRVSGLFFLASVYFHRLYKTLIKPAVALNYIWIAWGVYLVVESFFDIVSKDEAFREQVSVFLPYILALLVIPAFIIMPRAHLNLFVQIGEKIPFRFARPPEKLQGPEVGRTVTYLLVQALLGAVSGIGFFFVFTIGLGIAYVGILILTLIALFSAQYGIMVTAVLILLLLCVFSYASTFLLSAFIPMLISRKEPMSGTNSFSAALGNYWPLLSLFSFEALVKIIGLSIALVFAGILQSISPDFTAKNIFKSLSQIAEKSQSYDNLTWGLFLLLMAVFNIFWDIFKSIFISLLYYRREIFQNQKSLTWYHTQAQANPEN